MNDQDKQIIEKNGKALPQSEPSAQQPTVWLINKDIAKTELYSIPFNREEIINRINKGTNIGLIKLDDYEKQIKLCSEAHKKKYGKDVVELTNEAEYWKMKRDLDVQSMTESIDTLQRKVDEGTRKLIDWIDNNEDSIVYPYGVLINKIKELRQTLKGGGDSG